MFGGGFSYYFYEKYKIKELSSWNYDWDKQENA